MFLVPYFQQIVDAIIPYPGDNSIWLRQGDLNYPIIHNHLHLSNEK